MDSNTGNDKYHQMPRHFQLLSLWLRSLLFDSVHSSVNTIDMAALFLVLPAIVQVAGAATSTFIPNEFASALPSVTPQGVVNLFLQELYGDPDEFDASVVNSAAGSATYWVACASSVAASSCPFDATAPYNGLTVTQGATGMQVAFTESGLYVLFPLCYNSSR